MKIPKEMGVLKSQNLEAKFEAELEFPGRGGGVQNKKLSVVRVWIFCGTAHFQFIHKGIMHITD